MSAFDRVAKSVTLAGREYAVGPFTLAQGRLLRPIVQQIIGASAGAGKGDVQGVLDTVAVTSEALESLRHVPSIGADWDRIEAEATEEELGEAFGIVMMEVVRPLASIKGGSRAS